MSLQKIAIETLPPVALFKLLRPAIVTIDGPAASGKSTVGYDLAQLIDYLFFDTGILYRAVTWAALQAGLALTDHEAVSRLAERLPIDLTAPTAGESDGRQATVLVEGHDATWQLRTPQVDQNVSVVSAYPLVRQALGGKQRQIGHRFGTGQAEKAGVVMVGRDIGTVVLPEARLKIFMDASPEERARRRYQELLDRGKAVDYEQLLADLIRRDKIDRERAVAPLRAAADAVVIDTSTLSPEGVIERIIAAAWERIARANLRP